MILEKINNPSDLKKLNIEQLNMLSSDIRDALFNRLTKKGGHFGPNFGSIEATIAMHYVFNSPIDKFVFDVSHQCYTHKILTGRKKGFLCEEEFNNISGYSNPDESDHDFFKVGHTSTSISLASGLAKARDVLNYKENIIAFIGDGSLSGGQALEALDYIGSELNSNFIVVVNDNDMAIAENHGGIYKNLKELRDTNGKCSTNLFKTMGLDYIYEPNGNDIKSLIDTFNKVKDINHPIVVHINTTKGKGYKIAEDNKESWHWCMPFNKETGESLFNFDGEDYATITSNYLLNKIKEDKSIVVVTPAMPMTIGFNREKRLEAKDNFVDVGIAEEQAVALISGLAKRGCKPVLGTNATFMQRTYDQVSQDLCINNNPATIILNYTSLMGLNDVTHLGIFALSIFTNIPNLCVLAPTCKKEYLNMLEWSINDTKHPKMILMPGNGVINDNRSIDSNYDDMKYKVEEKGKNIAILALGTFYQLGEEITKEIEIELGFKPTLINPRFASIVDEKLLEELKEEHDLIITIEDGIIEGGFGSKIASFYGDSDIKVINYGLKKEFYDRYNYKELLKQNRMTKDQILEDIKKIY